MTTTGGLNPRQPFGVGRRNPALVPIAVDHSPDPVPVEFSGRAARVLCFHCRRGLSIRGLAIEPCADLGAGYGRRTVAVAIFLMLVVVSGFSQRIDEVASQIG